MPPHAAAIGFVALFVVHFVYPKGMGFGDVRLAGLVGGAAGWMGFRAAFVAFFLMFLLGSVGGIVQIVAHRGGQADGDRVRARTWRWARSPW